jgi:quinol monooxygenase YgiN
MIYVISTIALKEGRREDYLQQLCAILPIIHAEEGCFEYCPTIDIDTGSRFQKTCRPDIVIIQEKWESLNALKRHGLSPHMTDFRHRVKPLVQSMELQVLSPVA